MFSTAQAQSIPSSSHIFILEISIYMRRHLPITRRMRGLDGSETDQLHNTPSVFDIDGDLELVQKLECSSDQTLKELTDEFACRNADIPEAIDHNPNACGSVTHWTSADDAGFTGSTSYTKYTPNPLATDKCILIDGCLYGTVEPSETTPGVPSYVKALLSHTFPSDSPLCHVKYGGATLETVRLSSLSNLALHRPYWLLHVGDCEHIWTIDAIRCVEMQLMQPFIVE